ncbi:amino acid ABC transporter ATP-binding protein [Paenibacillus sp. GCM10023252]|uniref:amino acid ABC transporter ATP-binding protein n=1 Tax=Paenibacillus sp. GCM10023252 TaxID=3252649 RepID=UPI0036182227
MLNITGLEKSFGEAKVLSAINLTIRQGEVTSILGPSGSGKTTLLRCINLLETPDGGEIVLNGDSLAFSGGGAPARREISRIRRHTGMVFQGFNLFTHKTVLENVIEGPIHVKGVSRAEAVKDAERLLDKVGMLHKKDAYPIELSGGQQQRVAIARALALKPSLMLFDEPTSALDPILVGEVLEVIQSLAAEGMTMLVVTHEMQFARQVSDRIIFMRDGRIVEDTTPDSFFTSPQTEEGLAFVGSL